MSQKERFAGVDTMNQVRAERTQRLSVRLLISTHLGDHMRISDRERNQTSGHQRYSPREKPDASHFPRTVTIDRMNVVNATNDMIVIPND